MAHEQGTQQNVGPNEWLVDEMYEQYLADPKSVSESWQEFFTDKKLQSVIERQLTNMQSLPTSEYHVAQAPPIAPTSASHPGSNESSLTSTGMATTTRGKGAAPAKSNKAAFLMHRTETGRRDRLEPIQGAARRVEIIFPDAGPTPCPPDHNFPSSNWREQAYAWRRAARGLRRAARSRA